MPKLLIVKTHWVEWWVGLRKSLFPEARPLLNVLCVVVVVVKRIKLNVCML